MKILHYTDYEPYAHERHHKIKSSFQKRNLNFKFHDGKFAFEINQSILLYVQL